MSECSSKMDKFSNFLDVFPHPLPAQKNDTKVLDPRDAYLLFRVNFHTCGQ